MINYRIAACASAPERNCDKGIKGSRHGPESESEREAENHQASPGVANW